MPPEPPSGRRLRLNNLLLPVLLVLAAALAAALSLRYDHHIDLTRAGRHTLAEASLAVLDQLEGPVRVTAFASRRRQLRDAVQRFMAPWQRHKPDIELEFIDPDAAPERVRAEGISRDGAMIVRYGGREERLSAPTEQAMANLLQRLAREQQRWLAFVTGHGERAPHGEANFDLGRWVAHLEERGFGARALNLAETGAIPDNTAAVVLAGPRVALLEAEIRLLVEHVEGGGRLLWLRDPDSPQTGLAPLAAALGIEWVPGTVVDPRSKALGLDNPALIAVTGYPEHAITEGLRYVTLFPIAGTLAATGRGGWRHEGLLRTGDEAWNETGSLEGTVDYDPGEDHGGPLALALALRRTREAGPEQRAVVAGDGDFLSNSFIGNGGNLDLGLRIVNWLVADDAFIRLPARDPTDRQLAWPRATGIAVFFALLVVLPATLAGAGLWRWMRRRRR